MPSERQHRREIATFGKMLYDRGYVAAMDGNLSVRLDEERILATPTSMSKGFLRPADMVIVDSEGHLLAGRHNVSSEIAMHLLIYKLRPDIQGIVHAHPPTATGFAAAGIALNQAAGVRSRDRPWLDSARPLRHSRNAGTSETLEPLIPQYDAILMSNHGVVAYADTLHHAYMKMETVEHFAQIALVTHLLGRQQPLKARTSKSSCSPAASIKAPTRSPPCRWPADSPPTASAAVWNDSRVEARTAVIPRPRARQELELLFPSDPEPHSRTEVGP